MDLIIEKGEGYRIYSKEKGNSKPISEDSHKILVEDFKDISALLVELDEKNLRGYFYKVPNSLEHVCRNLMDGKPVESILEEGKSGAISKSEMLKKYDISNKFAGKMFAGYFFFHHPKVNDIIEAGFQSIGHEVYTNMNRINNFGYDLIDPGQATSDFFSEFVHLAVNDLEKLKHFKSATHHFIGYIAKVREQEYWKSEIENFKNRYQAPIGLCVGNPHILFVKGVLEGNTPKLHSIKEYFTMKNPDTLSFLE